MKGKVLINKEEAKYRIVHSSFITFSIKTATEESKFNYWVMCYILIFATQASTSQNQSTYKSPGLSLECCCSTVGPEIQAPDAADAAGGLRTTF